MCVFTCVHICVLFLHVNRILYVRIQKSPATHCNTLQHIQHTATHCNTLQHTATHCNTLQHVVCIVYYHVRIHLCICNMVRSESYTGLRSSWDALSLWIIFCKRAPIIRSSSAENVLQRMHPMSLCYLVFAKEFLVFAMCSDLNLVRVHGFLCVHLFFARDRFPRTKFREKYNHFSLK